MPKRRVISTAINKSSLRARSATDPALSPELTLAITHVPLSSLSEYGNNPRTHSPEQIQQIAESIKAFGFISPMIVDPAGELIAGHGRLAAAKLLALQHVPVVGLEHLIEAQKKALR